jgi:hypothetical protein
MCLLAGLLPNTPDVYRSLDWANKEVKYRKYSIPLAMIYLK